MCEICTKLKPATSLKLTPLHGCFSRFLNYTNGSKSRKGSLLNVFQISIKPSFIYDLIFCFELLCLYRQSTFIMLTFSFFFGIISEFILKVAACE